MPVLKRNHISFLITAVLLAVSFSCNHHPAVKPQDDTTIKKVTVEGNTTFTGVDKSPMDMSFYPEDFPMKKMAGIASETPLIRLIYSRPQKNGRQIFADSTVTTNFIQHYGQEWRLGANEATEIEFFRDVTIKGKKFAKGRYIIYCIPYPQKWTIIFNTNLFSWGLHMDKTKDIAQVDLPVYNSNIDAEYFTMEFQKAAYGCDLVMAWGNIKATIPISFN